jgi:hypothetical protein
MMKISAIGIEKSIEALSTRVALFFAHVVDTVERNAFKKVLTVASVALLLAVTGYVGAGATKWQATTSDQFVSTYNYADISHGEPLFASEHTNVIKAPVLWLQGRLNYNYTSLVAVNVGFMALSLLLWLYMLRRLFGPGSVAVGALAFSAILLNSTTFVINIAMTTIRHIEYPLALLFILWLSDLIKTPRRYLIPSVGLSVYLGLLIFNDRFFLYTLVPAGLCVAAYYAAKNKVPAKATVITVGVLISGSVLGLALPILFTHLGIIGIVPGYTNTGYFLSYEVILNALLIAIKQTLDLFGGFFFGQQIRLANASLVLCSLMFLFAVTGAVIIKNKIVSRTHSTKELVYWYFIFIIVFVYLAYIVPGLISESNARYLTFLVYIGVAFITWLVLLLANRFRWVYIVSCLFLFFLSVLALPRAHATYVSNSMPVNALSQEAEKLPAILNDHNVSVVGSSGGYQALRFWSHQKVKQVFEVFGDCKTYKPWSNNKSWLEPSSQAKTAFLVDAHEHETSLSRCKDDQVVSVYGQPEEIIKVTNKVYNFGAPVYLYIYNYDIRTRLVAPNYATISTYR